MKYHINPETGRVNICRADKKSCPLGSDAPHFTNKEKAKKSAEKILAKQHGTIATTKKAKEPEPSVDIEVLLDDAVQETNFDDLNDEDFVPEDVEELDNLDEMIFDDYDSSGDECENCGDEKPSVRFVIDPFEFEIHGNEIYRNLCRDCLEELQDF